jgi:membrane protein DedA with SNARE-associated domain
MLEQLINYLNPLVLDYGALGVFVGSLIEEIVAPIPSALVGMSAGFFLMNESAISLSSFQSLFLNVMLPISAGVTLGSLFVYGLTYFLGKPVIDRYGRFLGVSWREIQDAEERFSKGNKDGLILLGARTVPIIPSAAISAFCGVVRMNIKKYIFYTFLGTLVRAFMLGIIGWQVGSLYQRYASLFSEYENYLLIIMVICIISYLYLKNRKNIQTKLG